MSTRPCIIVLGSRNPGKLREFQAGLDSLPVELRSLDAYPGVEPPEETGETFAENARLKATALARQLGTWVLADDSGLCVDALAGRPGARSARYGGPHATDEERVAMLLEELRDVPEPQRTGRFVCALVLASPERILLEFQASCEGVITRQPRGTNGFGYDPIFFYPPLGVTFAELPLETKNRVSHRGLAIQELRRRLGALLGTPE